MKSDLKTYTKRDITNRVAQETNTDLRIAGMYVNHVFTAIRKIMMSANPSLRIEIRGFGVIEVKTTKSKPRARNPRSGEVIFVPPRRKTHFKPSKLIKKFLSQPLDGQKVAKEKSLV